MWLPVGLYQAAQYQKNRPDLFVNTSGCKPFAVENFQRCFPLSPGKFGTLINHVMIDNAIPG